MGIYIYIYIYYILVGQLQKVKAALLDFGNQFLIYVIGSSYECLNYKISCHSPNVWDFKKAYITQKITKHINFDSKMYLKICKTMLSLESYGLKVIQFCVILNNLKLVNC